MKTWTSVLKSTKNGNLAKKKKMKPHQRAWEIALKRFLRLREFQMWLSSLQVKIVDVMSEKNDSTN